MSQRVRLIGIAALALLLAGMASVGVFRIVRQAEMKQGEQVAVVALTHDTPIATLLSANDLHLVKVPVSAVPVGSLRKVSDAVGRGVVVEISKNEILTEPKLAAKDAGAGLPSMIPQGMRAVSVKVNEVVSVAGFVQPGTYVDVILTGEPSPQHNNQDVTTTTVLQNVKVLAAGTQLQQNAKGEAQNVPVITLLVDPEGAQKLTLAATEGKIQLSLRNPMDKSTAQTAALRNSTLYPHAAMSFRPAKLIAKPAAIAAAPAPTVQVVEIIRGGKKDQARF